MAGDADEKSKQQGEQDDRDESPNERRDRNWIELLQELRVVQTGVQLLTGFLLTLPFQQKFPSLTEGDRRVYMAAITASILATGFLQAPVAVHRALFRRHRKEDTVQMAHRLAIVGIFFLACAVISVTTLIFDVVLGWTEGLVAGGLATTLLVTLWLAVPWAVRTRSPVLSPPSDGGTSGS